LRGLVPRLVDLLREILSGRQELLVERHPYPGMEKDLAALVPPDFLRCTPFDRLREFPRYLKAMKLRAERARKNPAKDAERAALLAPYVPASQKVAGRPGGEAFRWLVEEFRVSLFAQELGTAEPVSSVKLDRELAALQVGGETWRDAMAPVAAPPAKAIIAVPVAAKKTPPLKNLGALDKLFPR
jgi:ATP-dependent helicase HrpA